ncbi:LOB domain-containing protein 27 [Vitis vinifera]|uniref:LOB domain-containing protein 27 n=1 Tax=Vitis vinifera TaxID=29760 RepID=A0A438DJ80_VITVI|nr:LOB domain-containing protein 27 [Vitis vinifera]
MTLKGGTSQACAACKYQRRKCSSECPLAPYFPPDQPKMFANAHRLLVSATSLKFSSNWTPPRNSPPCSPSSTRPPSVSAIRALSLHHNPPPPPPEYNAVSVAGGGDGGLPVGVGTHHPYSPTTNAPFNFDFLDPKDNSLNPAWPQNSFSITNNNDVPNSLTIQPQPVATQPLPLQPQAAQDYDEIHPFFDTFDDRQSYVDSKEAYESSSESSFKDATQSTDNVAENELKSAAACFSLISLGQ